VLFQPGGDRRRRTIFKEGDRALALQIDTDRAITLLFFLRRVIAAHHFWGLRLRQGETLHKAEKGVAAGIAVQHRANPRARITAQREADLLLLLRQPQRSLRRRRDQRGQNSVKIVCVQAGLLQKNLRTCTRR
jgi:hypothetical protein